MPGCSGPAGALGPALAWLGKAAIVGSLSACAVAPTPSPAPSADISGRPDAEANSGLPPPITRAASRWVPVPWSELPRHQHDALHEAWPAWVLSCERPAPGWSTLCPEVRRLAKAAPEVQQAFVR